LDIILFKLAIMAVVDRHTTWPHYFWSEFVGLYFNFFRNKFCARNALKCLSCPVEMVLEGNILLYNGVLSFRLTEYLGLEGCATMKNVRS